MTKFLSTISLLLCIISVKSQLNYSQNFENASSVYPYFSGYYQIQNGSNYSCSGYSLTFNEFGYGSMIAYPRTITFSTTQDEIIEKYKNINISFKYRYNNPTFQEMRIVVRYELYDCFSTPKTGILHDIFIDNTQFSGNCINLSSIIPGNLINMSFCKLKIYFDLYSTSKTGTSTLVAIDDFLVSQTTLGTNDNEISNNKVYPNPFTNFIILKSFSEIEKITLLDETGRIILHQNITDNKINTQFLKSGLYILKIQNRNGTEKIEKLIKK